MTNETKHTPTPYYVDGNMILDEERGNLICSFPETSNNHHNAAHILKCVNTRDELVDALTAADVLLAELGHSLPQVKTALKKASE